MPLQLQVNPGEYTFVLPVLDRLCQRPSTLYCDICTSSTCWRRKFKIFVQKFSFFPENLKIFRKFWNVAYLTSSAAAISMSMQYFAFGFRPFTIVLYAGNIRLKLNFSIIVSLEIHIFSKWPKFDIENVLDFFFIFFLNSIFIYRCPWKFHFIFFII